MIHKKLLFCILFLSIVSWFAIGKKSTQNISEQENRLGVSTSDLPSHPLKFFDKETFYGGIFTVQNENKQFGYSVKGGIVPHHLLPGIMIADFFNRFSAQQPKTVILIGPNHYEKGNFKALTSGYGWQTPFGIVKPNEIVINTLISENVIKTDETVVSEDHAVAGIMPFVKYYLPDASVVPILLTSYMSREEIQLFADRITEQMDSHTVLVAA